MVKELQVYIDQTKTAQEAWEQLVNTYEAKSVTQLVRLSRRFYAANMPEGGNVVEYVTQMMTLAKQLREQDEDIASQKFAITILGGLPESYDYFLTSINARDLKTLTWETVKPALMEEYQKQKEKVASEGALAASKQIPKLTSKRQYTAHRQGPYRDMSTVKCYKCDKFGHIERNCRSGAYIAKERVLLAQSRTRGKRERKEKKMRIGGFRGTCHKCDEYGHMSLICPKPNGVKPGGAERKRSRWSNEIENSFKKRKSLNMRRIR